MKQTRIERSENRICVTSLCEWAFLVKSVSKLYLQVDLICQNRYWVSYRPVPGSIPPFSLIFDLVPLLFHSNFQNWQMRSLPTLDVSWHVSKLFRVFQALSLQSFEEEEACVVRILCGIDLTLAKLERESLATKIKVPPRSTCCLKASFRRQMTPKRSVSSRL